MVSPRLPPHPKGLFYGWVIVFAAFSNLVMVSGLGFQGFGAFLLPLEREFGWSKATLSAARSLMQIENGLLGPVEGWLVDRFGPQRIMLAGILIFAGGLVFLALVQSLWMYFAAFLVIAIGSSLGGFLVMSVAVNNWFRRKRTLALSLTQTGLGVGGALVVPVLVWAMATYGWRAGALGSGAALLAVGIPMAMLMRHRPEQYGLLPDGDQPQSVVGSDDPSVSQMVDDTDFTLGEALRTQAFWFIGLGHGLSIVGIIAVATHQFAHMEMNAGVGLTTGAAALVVTILSLTNVGGRLLAGLIGDRFDKRYLSAGATLISAVSMVIFAFAQSLVTAIIFGVLFGLTWGVRGPLMNSIRGEYFGRNHFGKIIGTSSLLLMPFSITAPIFAGYMADLVGNYRVAFLVLAAISTLGAILFLLTIRPAPPNRLIATP